jgi:hypothetical protein
MKKILFIIMFLIMVCNIYAGGTKIPKYINSLDVLEDVKTKAQKKHAPIVFVCSDFDSKCSLRKGDNKNYFAAFKKDFVIAVPADGFNNIKKEALAKLPEFVKNVLNKSNKAPRVVICNSEFTKVIDTFDWVDKKGGERKKRFKKALKKIKKASTENTKK